MLFIKNKIKHSRLPLYFCVVFAFLSIVILSCCSCQQNTSYTDCSSTNQACQHEPSIKWCTDTIAKYRTDGNVNSLICVQADEGTHARVLMYKKDTSNGNITWTKVVECNANIGEDGLGPLTEENAYTPIGDFGVITAFGIKSNPGTSIPYVDVNENTYCCADSVAYNKIIDISQVPHECSGEHMIEYTPQYNYGFFLDYNKECVVGAGSAVFFHCKSPLNYTGACIAVEEEDMVTILQNIDIGCRVIIDYAPV